MKLFLYKVNDTENTVNKTLFDPLEIDIKLKSDTDIINPFIILKTITGYNFNDYNYAHIPDLERYYFIQSIDSVNAKMWRLF